MILFPHCWCTHLMRHTFYFFFPRTRLVFPPTCIMEVTTSWCINLHVLQPRQPVNAHNVCLKLLPLNYFVCLHLMYIKLHSFLGTQDPVNGRFTEMSTRLSLTTIDWWLFLLQSWYVDYVNTVASGLAWLVCCVVLFSVLVLLLFSFTPPDQLI